MTKLDKNEYRVPRRTGIWLLLASMLVNFFLLGLMVGPLLWPHHPFPPHDHDGSHGHFIDSLTRELPPNDAAVLRKDFEKQEQTLTAGHQGVDAAMHEVQAALAKPTVDQAELQKALDDVAAAHGKIQEGMSDLIKHAAADLSPEGRHIFAENGLHPPGMEGPPPGGFGHFPPPPPGSEFGHHDGP